ncbi:GDSL esterase/lipase [Raphanus sativus]|nr:GDSL esterase/lipase [Raphanus sativus]
MGEVRTTKTRAGVFDTIFTVPTASMQINSFERLLRKNVYSPADLNCSVAFFSFIGNDYIKYNIFNGTSQGRPALIRRVVKQILLDVKRIKDLGVRKVLVVLSPPQNCVPLYSTSKGCNTNNTFTKLHNSLIREGLRKLNDENNDKSFLMLDLYKAFMTIFKYRGVPGISTFPEPLKACCVGRKGGNSCGDVDILGRRLYSLCKDPKSFFFWDNVHITDEGWRSGPYELSFGKTSFKGYHNEETLSNVVAELQAKDLIKRLLKTDPETRLECKAMGYL